MIMFWNGIGVILSGLAAVLVLKETRKEFVLYVTLTMCILVFLQILPLLQEVSVWFHALSAAGMYGGVLLKAAGISMLTEMACELCRAGGENGLAGYAVLLGKGEILMLTLPLFRDLTEMAVGFAV